MKNERPLSFNRSFYWTGLIILIVNLFLLRLPLTSTFGYEFAAVNGLVLVIISGLFTLFSISKADHRFFNLIINQLLFVLLPLAVTIINSLLTMFCSFWDGLFFYVLIVITSSLFGSSLAFLIDFIVNRFKKTIFMFTIFVIALIPIFEIYFLPQVYFYSPLIGFFPGNIYDEGLSPDLKLFFHQFIIIAFSISIIYILIKKKDLIDKHKWKFISILTLIVIIFQFISPYLGFTTTFSKLESILPKKVQSEYITLHYDKIDSSEAKFIALNQEFYFEELTASLKTKPSKNIDVYLFNNRLQKKELFGAGNADVAKPWQYAIYISADSWEHTLKHELVHVFSAEFGTGPFKLASRFNPALIEGMAEAIEGTTDFISLMDFTALAYNHNYKIELNSLFSGLNFFKSGSSLAYTYSGAFIQFVIEKYGIEKVKIFYADGDFNSVFSSDLNLVQKLFQNKLKATQFGNQAMADYYFGRLSILQKVCPRYISDRLGDAYEYLSIGKLDDAESLFNEINDKTINYSAIVGLSEIFLKKTKYQKAIKIIQDNLNQFNGTPYYHNLIFRLGDLYASNQQIDSSLLCFNKLVDANPNHVLNYLSSTRISLLQENKMRTYLNGEDSLKLNMLVELNRNQYHYNSLPLIVDLLSFQKANYKASLSIFDKTLIVDNLESSYAAYKLSQYMLENEDYINARKYAALSLRVKEGNSFYTAMQEHFKKTNWFFKNTEKVLGSFIFDINIQIN
jgi:tetratricopeptide (TPR) repeat protein